MSDIVERLRTDIGGSSRRHELMMAEAAAEIERSHADADRLRGALEALKIAVDREGWPAGWGQIRGQVLNALGIPNLFGAE